MAKAIQSTVSVSLSPPNAPETQTYVSQQVLGQPRRSRGLGHTLHSLLSQHRLSSIPGL